MGEQSQKQLVHNWKTQLIDHQLGFGWQSQVAGIVAEAAGPSVDDNCVVVVEEELSYCLCFVWKALVYALIVLLHQKDRFGDMII